MGKIKTQQTVINKIALENRLLLIRIGLSIAGILILIFLILFFIGPSFKSKAAPPASIASIGGVINSYAQVTGFSNANKRFTITNISGSDLDFAIGSKILVIQMKGASLTETNDSNYGNVSGYARAGNYEFATVVNKTGTGPSYQIFVDDLENNYSAAGNIQLVSVPQYENAQVNSPITSTPWSASTGRGGIIVLEVKNELILNSNINVDGAGFSGGVANPTGNGGATNNNTYRTNSTSGFAQKGEGIRIYTADEEYGRGAWGNGGGGGNTHNAGGGGGGNFTAGGEGGTGWGGNGGAGGQGIGGNALTYNAVANRIFMGGGGGGGQQNDVRASSGANGGGLIIVRAKTLNSTCSGTFSISANGISAEDAQGNDGAGGGGGGGTVFIDVLEFPSSCNINITATGGNGGTVLTGEKHGGGGGGGSGALLFNVAPGANIITDNTRGIAGMDCNGNGCTSTASPGQPCTSNCTPIGWTPEGDVTLLPVELLFFKGKVIEANNVLEWETANETNNDFFTIEKSIDGKHFFSIGKIKGNGNKSSLSTYLYIDKFPQGGNNFYKLTQTDFDGQTTTHSIVLVSNELPTNSDIVISPNPFSHSFKIEFTSNFNEDVEIQLIDSNGKLVYNGNYQAVKGRNIINYSNGNKLEAGLYFLKVSSRHIKLRTIKILKQ